MSCEWNIFYYVSLNCLFYSRYLLFYSVTKLCLTSCDPMDCSTPSFPVLHYLPEFAQIHVHWVDDVIQPSYLLSPPHLLLPSIFPNIRVFSNELAFPIRWPKYWSFSFDIIPSKEYSELISFRTDWFDLLAVQGDLNVFSSTTVLDITILLLFVYWSLSINIAKLFIMLKSWL